MYEIFSRNCLVRLLFEETELQVEFRHLDIGRLLESSKLSKLNSLWVCTGFLPVCLKQCPWLLALSFFCNKSSYEDSGQKVLEGMQKIQLFERCKTRITRLCQMFPKYKIIPKFWDLVFCQNDPNSSLSHGICLFTAYGYGFLVFFLLCLVGVLPKVLFFVRLSHSLSNTFSQLLVNDSQKLETVVLSGFICVFNCMVCKNTGSHKYRQHAVALSLLQWTWEVFRVGFF